MEFFPLVDAKDGGLSHIFPKSQSTSGLKLCKTCLGMLPPLSFPKHATNRDRLSNFCRTCTNLKQKPYKLKYAAARAKDPNWKKKVRIPIIAWNLRHPERIAEYRARRRKKEKEIRSEKQRAVNPNWPNPPPCPKHGEHSNWKNCGGHFHCQKCKEENHAAANLRAIIKRIRRTIGDDFAREYIALSQEPSFLKLNGTKRIFEVKRVVFLRDFGLKVDLDISKRIGLMNRISGQAFHAFSIGWLCKQCSLHDLDPRAFDIDHILARSLGGTDAIANLQILCPNCHRKKTLADNAKARANRSAAQEQSACKPEWRPQSSAYDIPAGKQGNWVEPSSGPTSREPSQCITAASLSGSSDSQTSNTSHTPSTFAAPTQSPYTADAVGSVATPVVHGI